MSPTTSFISRPAKVMVPPKGITANMLSAAKIAIIGAMTNSGLSAAAGMRSSLVKDLMPSAMGCKSPKGPTLLGPGRTCTWPSTFRSKRVR